VAFVHCPARCTPRTQIIPCRGIGRAGAPQRIATPARCVGLPGLQQPFPSSNARGRGAKRGEDTATAAAEASGQESEVRGQTSGRRPLAADLWLLTPFLFGKRIWRTSAPVCTNPHPDVSRNAPPTEPDSAKSFIADLALFGCPRRFEFGSGGSLQQPNAPAARPQDRDRRRSECHRSISRQASGCGPWLESG